MAQAKTRTLVVKTAQNLSLRESGALCNRTSNSPSEEIYLVPIYGMEDLQNSSNPSMNYLPMNLEKKNYQNLFKNENINKEIELHMDRLLEESNDQKNRQAT